MNNAFFEIPIPINEPVKEYRNGSPEKKELLTTLNKMRSETIDIPMIIDGKESVGFLCRVKEYLEDPAIHLLDGDVKKSLGL